MSPIAGLIRRVPYDVITTDWRKCAAVTSIPVNIVAVVALLPRIRIAIAAASAITPALITRGPAEVGSITGLQGRVPCNVITADRSERAVIATVIVVDAIAVIAPLITVLDTIAAAGAIASTLLTRRPAEVRAVAELTILIYHAVAAVRNAVGYDVAISHRVALGCLRHSSSLRVRDDLPAIAGSQGRAARK